MAQTPEYARAFNAGQAAGYADGLADGAVQGRNDGFDEGVIEGRNKALDDAAQLVQDGVENAQRMTASTGDTILKGLQEDIRSIGKESVDNDDDDVVE